MVCEYTVKQLLESISSAAPCCVPLIELSLQRNASERKKRCLKHFFRDSSCLHILRMQASSLILQSSQGIIAGTERMLTCH